MTINTNSCCPKCLIRCRCPDPKAHGHEDKCSNLACDCHTKPPEQVEGWRERWDKNKFIKTGWKELSIMLRDRKGVEKGIGLHINAIKEFIDAEIAQVVADTEARMAAGIEEKRKDWIAEERERIEAALPTEKAFIDNDGHDDDNCRVGGWNSYRSAALKVIRGNDEV